MTAQQVESLPEAQAREALDAWVKAKKPELAQALSLSSSKVHAKLAKKALYQLQSSGVQAPAPARAEEPATPVEPQQTANDFPGVLSMQLGTGERAFFFAVPMRGGGLELFQGIVHDEFGLAQFGSLHSNRNQYRRRMRELEQSPDEHVMLVPFERIKLELGRAMTLNERTKTEYNSEIAQALARIGITPQDPDVAIPPLEPGDAERAEDGAALHALPEIEQWLPSEQHLVALANRSEAIAILPLTEEQRNEKRVAYARQLAAETFTAEIRTLYARRLWYSAEVVEHLGRADDAAKLRAEARRLAHSQAPSRFAEALFEKALKTIKPKAGAMPALKGP